MPHADLRVGKHLRLYSELLFDNEFGRNGGPRPGIDQDAGDVHQAFIELGQDIHANEGMSLRIGRQEMVFGTGRLLDNNEGVNVKVSFDGIRTTLRRGSVTVDLFAVKPVEINPGFFDDSPDHRRSVWSAYTTFPMRLPDHPKCDFYYIGYDAKRATYLSGSGREIRHSIGTRIFNRDPGQPSTPGIDYNWEAVLQWGALGPNSIHAWTLATETGYTLPNHPTHPRFVLRADAASGTRKPRKPDLGTFNPLFPRGAYFGPKLILAGPTNFIDLHPMLQLSPRQNISISAEWVFFWRESTSDGIYSPVLMILRPGNLSNARFVGSQPNLEVRWAVDPHLTLAFNVGGLFTGSFLRDNPPANGVAFGNAGVTYRF